MTTSYEQAVAHNEPMRPLFPEYDGDPTVREAQARFLDHYLAKLPARQRELLRAFVIERMPLNRITEYGGVRGYRGANPRSMPQHLRSARRAFLRAVAADDPAMVGVALGEATEPELRKAAARVLLDYLERRAAERRRAEATEAGATG